MTAPTPSPKITEARLALAMALTRQRELANASVNNPGLEPAYLAAVAAVATAETELREATS